MTPTLSYAPYGSAHGFVRAACRLIGNRQMVKDGIVTSGGG